MEKERMNTLIQEAETPSHNEANLQRWFSNIKTLGNNFKSVVFNEYIRVYNSCKKFDLTIDYKDTEVLDDF